MLCSYHGSTDGRALRLKGAADSFPGSSYTRNLSYHHRVETELHRKGEFQHKSIHLGQQIITMMTVQSEI